MTDLRTLHKKKLFRYEGSIKEGTTILFGEDRVVKVENETWVSLLNEFHNKTVRIGASRTAPPIGSLGSWLIQNVTKQAIASYIAPILIHEGYAKQEGDFEIKFVAK